MKYNFNQIKQLYNKFIKTYLDKGYKSDNIFTDLIPYKNYKTILKNNNLEFNISISYNYVYSSILTNNIRICIISANDYKLVLYPLSPHYYTDNINDIVKSKEIHLNRDLNYLSRKPFSVHINKYNLSLQTKQYLNNKINKWLDSKYRSHEYSIRDIYFSYNEYSRDFIVVIKHSDNIGTEALYLNLNNK